MENVKTISVKVTEEIDTNKLFTFLRTQIELQSLFITDATYFYYSFIAEVLRYEIIVFDYKNSFELFPFFCFSQFDKTNHHTVLFITKTFFALYQKQKLLVYKEATNIAPEDIVSYIKQQYQLNPSQIIYIDEEQSKKLLSSCTETTKKNIAKNIYKVIPNNSFKYFVIYTITVSIIALYLFFNSYFHILNKSTKNSVTKLSYQQNHTLSIYKKHQKNNPIKTLLMFEDYLYNNKIDFQKVEFDKNIFKINLQGEDKNRLFKSLEYSTKKVVLHSLKLQEDPTRYSMDVWLYE